MESDSQIIINAIIKIHDIYSVSQKDICKVIGVSPSHFYKLKKADSSSQVNLKPKNQELALCFIEVFRLLDSIFSCNSKMCQKWVTSNNTDFADKSPLEIMKSIYGLYLVKKYLEAYHSKV